MLQQYIIIRFALRLLRSICGASLALKSYEKSSLRPSNTADIARHHRFTCPFPRSVSPFPSRPDRLVCNTVKGCPSYAPHLIALGLCASYSPTSFRSDLHNPYSSLVNLPPLLIPPFSHLQSQTWAAITFLSDQPTQNPCLTMKFDFEMPSTPKSNKEYFLSCSPPPSCVI